MLTGGPAVANTRGALLTPAAGTHAPIIGRESEFGRVVAWLDSLSTGLGGLLIEGEPGIGKTTVWKAVVTAAELRGCRILRARPSSAESRLSYGVLGDLLDGVVERALPLLPLPQRRALAMALLLEEAVDEPADQRAVAVATRGVLRALCEDGPVLIAIDDLHWIDPPSRGVLAFALRRMENLPIGLFGAVRPRKPVEDLADSIPAGRLERLTLGPLSLGALQRVIRSRVDSAFERTTLLRLHRESHGNTLVALETAQALAGGPDPAPGRPLPVPAAAAELLRARLAGISAETRHGLLVLAAAPVRTVDELGALLGAPDVAERLIGEARSAALLDDDPRRLRFAHPLMAAVLYDDAAPEARRRLHRDLAAKADDPEQRARHVALGAESPDERAAATVEEGARRADAAEPRRRPRSWQRWRPSSHPLPTTPFAARCSPPSSTSGREARSGQRTCCRTPWPSCLRVSREPKPSACSPRCRGSSRACPPAWRSWRKR